MDEKLTSVIDRVKRLAQQNPEFERELITALVNLPPSKIVQSISTIKSDVSIIREALQIRANCSISYDFIPASGKYQRLKDQLIVDNLRMENASIGLKTDEKERFYSFCVNAFYQIENIINYYYYVLYPSIDNLKKSIEVGTATEKENYQYHPKNDDDIKSVADISISYKIDAFCNTNFPKNKNIKITYSQLRQVRNEGEHRCMVLLQEKDENKSLYKFFRYNSFNDIRQKLIKLVNAVKHGIEEDKK